MPPFLYTETIMQQKTKTQIVVDLGFGDAGKGTMVDALARQSDVPGLVVRHNGGAQAVHNVITPDGRQHAFSQFGAASLIPGWRTLHSRFMLLQPLGLMPEAKHLEQLGMRDVLSRLLIDREALVITPFHQAANRLREYARHGARHGSCGMGIGETMSHSLLAPEEAVHASDLFDRAILKRKFELIRARKMNELAAELREFATMTEASKDVHVFQDLVVLEHMVQVYHDIGMQLQIIGRERVEQELQNASHLIFEGAQGVLLDEWHGFHPHTTWSTTTSKNADQLLAEAGREGSVETIGVLRAYSTRHGEGPFVTHDPELSRTIPEMHNRSDGWQGNFRVGWLDLVLGRYALEVCPSVSSLAITNLDRLQSFAEWQVCDRYRARNTRTDDGELLRFDEQDTQLVREIQSRPPEDLDFQERLGKRLRELEPVISPSARASDSSERARQHVERISECLQRPVSCLSFGPRATDKRFRA